MTRGRVELRVGSSRVLREDGVFLVTELNALGVTLQPASGDLVVVPYSDLGPITGFAGGRAQAVHRALLPDWETLSAASQNVALDRLEVVLEILTGYRYGFAALKADGEPRQMLSTEYSLTARCAAMAREMVLKQRADSARVRRQCAGELGDRTPGKTTVWGWVKSFQRYGVWGLVDGRATRPSMRFNALDERFRELAQAEAAIFNGDVSTVNVQELLRRIQVAAQYQGVRLNVPQRQSREYVSWLLKQRGKGTRAQRSRSMRDTAGHRHYPAMRPGQVVAIDATRADVLVWDERLDRSCSVEILTAIDVATRVVLGLRVVPKSASGVDAGLLMYDVMRPFALLVEGFTATDWRWAGIPEAVEFSCTHPDAGLSAATAIEGVHRIPSVRPVAVRCDHGSIFTGGHFVRLLNDLGIDLMLSRGTRPTDNPHIERWHETLQQVMQQIAGFKGRNPFERGRHVGMSATDRDRPLITARELERQLRLWVALHYHRDWHEGLVLPDAPSLRLSPLEFFDALVQVTGRIDVPQRPDLLYQFLPVRWRTIQHDGVEITNMTYDDPVLDDFRKVHPRHLSRRRRQGPVLRRLARPVADLVPQPRHRSDSPDPVARRVACQRTTVGAGGGGGPHQGASARRQHRVGQAHRNRANHHRTDRVGRRRPTSSGSSDVVRRRSTRRRITARPPRGPIGCVQHRTKPQGDPNTVRSHDWRRRPSSAR